MLFSKSVAPIGNIIDSGISDSMVSKIPQLGYEGASCLFKEFLTMGGFDQHRDFYPLIESIFRCTEHKHCQDASSAMGIVSSLKAKYFEAILNFVVERLLGRKNVDIFCLETLYSATKTNSLNSMLPFVTLMLPSIIKGLTDQREKAKCVANKLFLWALPLLNFEESVRSPEGWSVSWKNMRDQDRTVLCQLFGSASKCASLVEFSSHVFKNVKLRSYQKEGISWLVAMEHVGLSGLLCDDMGLGKTVQSLLHL